MRFTATKLEGARVIQPQYHEDNRGLFARTYCAREFREQGLVDTFAGAVLDLIVDLRPDSAIR